jgi:hypothetical protein
MADVQMEKMKERQATFNTSLDRYNQRFDRFLQLVDPTTLATQQQQQGASALLAAAPPPPPEMIKVSRPAFGSEQVTAAARALRESEEETEIALEGVSNELADISEIFDGAIGALAVSFAESQRIQASAMSQTVVDTQKIYDDLKAATTPPSLDQLLFEDAAVSPIFQRFAEQKQCGEIVLFCEAVAEFRALPPGAAQSQRFAQVVSRFIAPGSPQEINIDGERKHELLALVGTDKITGAAFAQVAKDVEKLLVENVYSPFIKSKEFRHAKRAQAGVFRRELRPITVSLENLLRTPIGVVCFRRFLA